MKPITFYLIILFLLSCHARKKQVVDQNCVQSDGVYIYVDKMPQYGEKGGMGRYIGKNLNYPKQERFLGSFKIEFIVDEKGQLKKPRIKDKKISELTEVEREILKLLNEMPIWNPGSCNGTNVAVKMSLPIKI